MESLDNPVIQLMALHVAPNLQFEVAFLPQLAASFVPGRKASHLPPPKQGLCAFAPDMKINPQPRPFLAGFLWAVMLLLAAAGCRLIVGHLQPAETSSSYAHQWHSTVSRDLSLYSSTVAIAITGLWLTESYHADYLISPLTSSVVWVLVAIYQGWHKILPIWCCIQIFLSRSIHYYFMPRTMTDVGVARCLCPALFLVYIVPAVHFLAYPQSSEREQQQTWNIAHCALPLVSYMGSKLLRVITDLPSGIDAVFSDVDVPYQKSFQMTILLGSSVVHVFAALRHAAELFQVGTDLTTLAVVKDLSSLSAVIVVWCLFIAWDLKRVNAVDVSFPQSCVYILAMTMLCGPAATLAGTMSWRADRIAKAKAFRNRGRSSSEKLRNGKLGYLPLLYGEE
ncbi:hypothetical protein GJ744_004042 [Endocarpon pusillum]|uniref:Uncharacterized protein n=1 Tax=Endocarpon pusillum TaxID=364733 RepID=A0A8H7A9X5_9EURO|nr:hypothetical protein GJ744_004042 [Endocarpon pusillum]